jgi:hypothetical protein
MMPAPHLQELIETVRADAPAGGPLGELAQASATAEDLSQLGDKLMDHFVDQARRAGHSWSEISGVLGVSKQAAHKRFTGAIAPNFERFTLRARKVLSVAAAQAHALEHEAVRPEHLLLALFGPAEGLAAVVLAEAGISLDSCAQQLGVHAVADPAAPTGAVPYSPEAIELLHGSVEEALRLGHNYVGTEHLLLALYRDPESPAARALVDLGAERDSVATRLAEKLAALTLKHPF